MQMNGGACIAETTLSICMLLFQMKLNKLAVGKLTLQWKRLHFLCVFSAV